MTTIEINSIYRVTPDYLTSDGFVTHKVSGALRKELDRLYEEIGAVLDNTEAKEVYSGLKLEYYRNYLSLRKKH